MTITFDMLVNVAPNAITIERRDDSPGAPFTVGMVANVVQAITTVSGKTVVTLTFTPSYNASDAAEDRALLGSTSSAAALPLTSIGSVLSEIISNSAAIPIC